MRFNNRDDIIALTPQWKGERFPDGRPKVPDKYLDELRKMTLEELWKPIFVQGYENQFLAMKSLHPEFKENGELNCKLIGRAVTAAYGPTRPDFYETTMAQAAAEGRTGTPNQWVIECLADRDVCVVDMYDKIYKGTFVGGNLTKAIETRTKNGGAVIWGGIRDMEQIVKIDGINVYYRGIDPTGIGDVTMTGFNVPCRIGKATCLPGDVVLGTISGLLKSYCNVNEVISGIMLNWITLYLTNMLLTKVKEDTSPYTYVLQHNNPSAVLPSLGLGRFFNNNQYVGLAIPLAVLIAIVVWVVLEKTRFGYELRATGNNKNAAKYCGMAEKRNIILTLAISGMLAAMGASMLYLTGYEQWQCSTSSVPGMGFNGIAAAFLGGLNPIGTILASFFIQHITAGGAYVDKSMYCAQISDLISAIIIYLCGFVLFMKYAMNSAIARKEEKALLKAKEKEPEPLPDPAETKEGGDE